MFGFMPIPCCGCTSGADRRDYRALSCGLRNVLSRTYGLPTHFLINRDATFLHMLLASLMPVEPVATSTTCCNPLGAKHPLFQTGPAVEFAAAVTMCGVQVKLQDERADRRGALGAKALLNANRASLAKATEQLNRLHFAGDRIFQTLQTQARIEADVVHGTQKPHAAAEPTAAASGAIVGHAAVLSHTPTHEPLESLGRSLGRLVYWLDAVKDYGDDLRHNQFNPLWHMTREQTLTRSGLAVSALPLITYALTQIDAAVSELPMMRFQPMVQIMLKSGLRQKVRQTLNGALSEPMNLLPDEEEQKPDPLDELNRELEEEEEKRCRQRKQRDSDDSYRSNDGSPHTDDGFCYSCNGGCSYCGCSKCCGGVYCGDVYRGDVCCGGCD